MSESLESLPASHQAGLAGAVERLKALAGEVLLRLGSGQALSWERRRPGRIYVTVRREDAREFAHMLFEEFGARFATASGLDTGTCLEVVYHFPYDAAGLVVNMRVSTPKADGTLPSITPVVPAAEWIEREISDLVGIKFEGHPRPERLILSDDWPEGVCPLRREYRKEEGHDA